MAHGRCWWKCAIEWRISPIWGQKEAIATEQPRSISANGARLGRSYESCFLAVECDPRRPRSANGPISHESLPYPGSVRPDSTAVLAILADVLSPENRSKPPTASES